MSKKSAPPPPPSGGATSKLAGAAKNLGNVGGTLGRGAYKFIGGVPGMAVQAATGLKDIYDQYRDNPATAPIQSPESFHERIYGQGGFKRGGKVKGGSASRRADGMAHKGKTKGKMVKMAGGGMAYSGGGSVFRKGADGIASKGKTRGKMIKMAYGGKC